MAASSSLEGQVIPCHTDDEWNYQLQKGNDNTKLIVVDFTASWCGPCRFMAPFFAKKFPNVTFLKVDVDELKTVASDWAVEAMPTFMFIKQGKILDKASLSEQTSKSFNRLLPSTLYYDIVIS